jgi:hypothetical protein
MILALISLIRLLLLLLYSRLILMLLLVLLFLPLLLLFFALTPPASARWPGQERPCDFAEALDAHRTLRHARFVAVSRDPQDPRPSAIPRHAPQSDPIPHRPRNRFRLTHVHVDILLPVLHPSARTPHPTPRPPTTPETRIIPLPRRASRQPHRPLHRRRRLQIQFTGLRAPRSIPGLCAAFRLDAPALRTAVSLA